MVDKGKGKDSTISDLLKLPLNDRRGKLAVRRT
jgi:hypothetical protein